MHTVIDDLKLRYYHVRQASTHNIVQKPWDVQGGQVCRCHITSPSLRKQE